MNCRFVGPPGIPSCGPRCPLSDAPQRMRNKQGAPRPSGVRNFSYFMTFGEGSVLSSWRNRLVWGAGARPEQHVEEAGLGKGSCRCGMRQTGCGGHHRRGRRCRLVAWGLKGGPHARRTGSGGVEVVQCVGGRLRAAVSVMQGHFCWGREPLRRRRAMGQSVPLPTALPECFFHDLPWARPASPRVCHSFHTDDCSLPAPRTGGNLTGQTDRLVRTEATRAGQSGYMSAHEVVVPASVLRGNALRGPLPTCCLWVLCSPGLCGAEPFLTAPWANRVLTRALQTPTCTSGDI